jgi:hypothetical protein
MIRILKPLVPAFVATLAIVAFGAAAAEASQYTCSSYSCTVSATVSGGSETFTTPGGTVRCSQEGKHNGYSGILSAASSTLTLNAAYTGCVAFGFLNATFEFKGCDYLLHAGASKGGGVYDNKVDIVCPAGSGPITITAGTCKVDIPAQTGLSNVRTTNWGAGIVTVEPNLTNITMNVTTDGFGCPFAGTGHVSGSFHGHLTLGRAGGGTFSVSGS